VFRAVEVPERLLGERGVVACVTGAQRVGFAGVTEAFLAVLADGLEEAVTRL
jgi:hypothetical protein